MAINLDEIERGYAEAMHKKYSAQLNRFEEVFQDNPMIEVGGMHIVLNDDGSVLLKPGFGHSGSHNISNRDARHILNIIRMSIKERKDKFDQGEKS